MLIPSSRDLCDKGGPVLIPVMEHVRLTDFAQLLTHGREMFVKPIFVLCAFHRVTANPWAGTNGANGRQWKNFDRRWGAVNGKKFPWL